MAESRRSGRDRDHRLLHFLFRHLATGVAAGWTTLLLLIWTDAAGLGTLVRGSDDGALALALMAAGFAITFGSVAMGWAVMALGRREP